MCTIFYGKYVKLCDVCDKYVCKLCDKCDVMIFQILHNNKIKVQEISPPVDRCTTEFFCCGLANV